jgi:hypothetical protein
MKLFVCVFLMLLAGLQPVSAQTTEATYQQRLNELDSLRRIHWDAKNFRLAVMDLKEMHGLYESLNDSDKTRNRWADANTMYNTACAYSLADSIEQALNSLALSVEEGFNDYFLMRSDSDLLRLHHERKFNDLLAVVRTRGDRTLLLETSGPYAGESTPKPEFIYQSASDSSLVRLRKMYNLDSVAGSGDELSRIIRLMRWAHHSVRHDGNSANPPSRNAIDIIEVCNTQHRGVNCRMMATILNEAYLAMGFPSRHITCLPKDTSDTDCHVIDIVWSSDRKKWIWMDPTFEAYVTDERGDLLNISEVRERLIRGDSIRVADGINWNGAPYGGGPEAYLRNYMAKNLYWFMCPVSSEFGYESKKIPKTYIDLYPGTFNPHNKLIGIKNPDGDLYTNDAGYFWQKPAGH